MGMTTLMEYINYRIPVGLRTKEYLKQRMGKRGSVKQNHFGDHLVIEDPHAKIWLVHEENIVDKIEVWAEMRMTTEQGVYWIQVDFDSLGRLILKV